MRFTAKITALSYEGSGIGPIIAPAGEHVGRKVLVSGTIPGEEIELDADPSAHESGLLPGRLLSVSSAHSARRTPPCRYVYRCGGCSLQHVEVATQRAEKLRMIESLFLTQAKLAPRTGFSMIGGELPEFSYRNRIHLHLNKAGELGFYRGGTGDVVDIESCLLAEEELNAALAQVRSIAKEIAARVAAVKIERRERGVTILLKPRTRGGSLSGELLKVSRLGLHALHDEHRESATEDSGAGHFSQVNSEANEVLTRYVVDQFNDSTTKLGITEFYAGAGNFSLPLAQAGHTITAVELDSNLTRAGAARAFAAGLGEQINFITQSCEHFCKQSKIGPLVLLDPPRAGARIVAEALDPKSTRKIIYVSCNPATLLRDVRTLTLAGFTLEHIAVLDMFSQTAHVESVATLTA
jgi:23S rRNA (uracil1939-C5)-methyltransferase